MVLEKKPLSFADIEAQTALELPDRETLQTVIIGCLALCVGQITIRNVTVDVAATVCLAVQAANGVLGAANTGIVLECTTRNH